MRDALWVFFRGFIWGFGFALGVLLILVVGLYFLPLP